MYHSGEIRWYFPGEISRRVREWFESSGLGASEPARTDEYLYLPNCRVASVKVRESRLEVKALTHFPERVAYPNGVGGYRDAWVKWSREVSDEIALQELIGGKSDEWILVNKSRCLRKLSLDTGAVTEVDASREQPDKGCQVELTSIRARLAKQANASPDSTWEDCDPWWSLSLEAFGDRQFLRDDLDVAAAHLFRERPPVPLTERSSLSYPVWLATLFGEKS
jgi:hypothetical protein